LLVMFRSYCHDCGTVRVPGPSITVRVQVSSACTYRFSCPQCRAAITTAASRDVGVVLVSAGARLDVRAADPELVDVRDELDLLRLAIDEPPSARATPDTAADRLVSEPATVRPCEAAAVLQVSTAQLRRYEAGGRLVAMRTIGGHRRYREDDVHALRRWRDSRAAEDVSV
jgi:hypothetical protein